MPAGHKPFVVWNRSGNLLVAALLRSPAHPLLSGRLALITVTGRRSGRKHTFPVSYEETADGLLVPVMWPERKLWWRNLRDEEKVEVRLRGTAREGHAQAVEHGSGDVSVRVRLA